jgi:hypothetical protein
MQRSHSGIGNGEDDIRLHSYQFFCIRTREVRIAGAPAIPNIDIPAQ